MEPPLISLVIVAYRQEKLIDAAIQGALGQTHSNMEIVLSDDCSPDGTFERIQAAAEEYSGPHRVVTNRNSENLGLAAHINAALEIATGEWIVLAAGDDVSLPDRCSAISETACSDQRIAGILSGYIDCTTELKEIRSRRPSVGRRVVSSMSLARNCGYVFPGASFAFRRECIEKFGAIPSDIVAEDWLVPFRASLIGRLCLVPDCHLLKRYASTSLTRKNASKYREGIVPWPDPHYVDNLRCMRIALESGILTPLRFRILSSTLWFSHVVHRCYRSRPSFIRTIAGIFGLIVLGRFRAAFDVATAWPRNRVAKIRRRWGKIGY